MGDLACKLIGSTNPLNSIPLFEYFFCRENNQYSYENCLVYEDDKQVVGFILGYDGELLDKLRTPVLSYILLNYGVSHLNLEPETEAGEFYLDTVSVSPANQGRGIGRSLICRIISNAFGQGYKRIGLLVEESNFDAKRLYLSLGFKLAGKKHLALKAYEHLVIDCPSR